VTPVTPFDFRRFRNSLNRNQVHTCDEVTCVMLKRGCLRCVVNNQQ